MTDLREAWEGMADRLRAAHRTCVLTDYDGTLTPLAETPQLALLPPLAERVLGSLAGNPKVILGVFSGRSLADLRTRVGLNGIWYAGNHGYEIATPEGIEHRFYEEGDLDIVRRIQEEFRQFTFGIEGLLLENKGPILAIHYRLVDPLKVAEVEKAFLTVLEAHHKEVLQARGKLVLEIRLRGHSNKGTAVRFVRRALSLRTLILYFGDDLTDRDAFRALQGAGISVHVGPDDPGLTDYTLPNPAAVLEVMERIDTLLRRGHTTKRPLPRKKH